jgi:hypothetical protein
VTDPKITPTGTPLTESQLSKIADIKKSDAIKAVISANQELKPYLNAVQP